MMNLEVPLKEQVIEKLPWLFENLGFRVTWHEYNPKVFGDSLAELQSETLRLRFIRERGQIFAELAPLSAPEEWWDLSFLYEAIHREMPEPGFELESLASSLRSNHPALVEALGPKWSETKRELERRTEQRRQASMYARPESSSLFARIYRMKARMMATPARRVLFSALAWVLAAVVVWMVLR